MEAVDHIVLLIRKQIVTGSGGGVKNLKTYHQ